MPVGAIGQLDRVLARLLRGEAPHQARLVDRPCRRAAGCPGRSRRGASPGAGAGRRCRPRPRAAGRRPQRSTPVTSPLGVTTVTGSPTWRCEDLGREVARRDEALLGHRAAPDPSDRGAGPTPDRAVEATPVSFAMPRRRGDVDLALLGDHRTGRRGIAAVRQARRRPREAGGAAAHTVTVVRPLVPLPAAASPTRAPTAVTTHTDDVTRREPMPASIRRHRGWRGSILVYSAQSWSRPIRERCRRCGASIRSARPSAMSGKGARPSATSIAKHGHRRRLPRRPGLRRAGGRQDLARPRRPDPATCAITASSRSRART